MSANDKYDADKALKVFFAESREMMDTMESCLLIIEKDKTDSESINALFRAVHSIKGSSGMFNLYEIEKFTHKVENILDRVRKKAVEIDENLINILLKCCDYISKLLEVYEENKSAVLDESFCTEGLKLLKQLDQYSDLSASPEGEGKKIEEEFCRKNTDELPGEQVTNQYWHVSLRYGKDVFRHGLDPQSFISYLGEVGKIVKIILIKESVPFLEDIDPESCYLGFEILVDGIANKKTIDDIFEFVKDDCEIRILPPGSKIALYVKLINDLPENPMRIGEILVEAGCLTTRELRLALKLQEILKKEDGDSEPLLGEILVKEKMIHKPVLEASLEKQTEITRLADSKRKSIRIDSDKLDELINIIGELVITGANVRQIAEQYQIGEILQPVLTMSRLVENVRDRIMNIRMVKIGETFNRFERVVRDLSRDAGKEVDLIINGGETELDKSIVEKITDPLMHLVRNSLDHGIGKPEERLNKGKNRRGSLVLNAYHEAGNIVIEVKDDGNGLNREKICKKAVNAGLLEQNQQIEDNDLYQLIFEPGFSTAEKVTNISGRGVGMDVVKKNIESLRGSVAVESEEGLGMTTRIHLPLTLAIIDGFLVQVSGGYYVIPLSMVKEVFEVSREELSRKEGANIINLRGEVLPFMRLKDFFEEPDAESTSENIIVVEVARKKAGLVVDKLEGEFQTVIKPMGNLFAELQWISGATILGSGEVALILDVPRLIQNNVVAA